MQNDKGPSLSRRRLMASAASMAVVAGTGLCRPALAQGRQVTIISDESNPQALEQIRRVAAAFQKETGTAVTVNNLDHEANKTAIRSYLVAGAPDICFWFSGNRMRSFVKRGLFDDITDLVAKEHYRDVLGPALDAVTVDGKQYGLPLGGILWGMFYRKDVFADHGLTVPTTWDEFLAYGEKAKAAGLTPVSIGTKELWPAAGWFDEMNLRINGLASHMALMEGRMSYLDPALAPVFDKWEQLIKAGFFTPDETSYSWQEAAAFLSQKKAGMMNLGGFVRGAFPGDALGQLAFAPFPKIADIPRDEDFSANSIHIPANSRNKQAARDFLAYFYKPENLGPYSAATGDIPSRSDIKVSDPIVAQQQASLRGVAGTAQYYDRDTDPDMAQVGLNGFQEFMAHPDRRQAILRRLEGERRRVFKI